MAESGNLQAGLSDNLFVPASKQEREGVQAMREPSTYWHDVRRRFVKNKVALISLAFIAVIILFAFFGPFFSQFKYDQQIKGSEFIAPFTNMAHPLGTDSFGRDEFVRLMYGARVSIAIGIVASIMVVIIGVIYGAVAGYFGGWVDNIMMRVVDIVSSVPSMLIMILLYVVINTPLRTYLDKHPELSAIRAIGPSLLCIFITFALLYWTDMARMVRGEILKVKTTEYVGAARALGANSWRIITKHLIPNSMGVILVTATMNIPTAIFNEAYLSFIGLGVSPPMCSLGSLANDGLSVIYSHPELLILPSIFISLIILAFNLVGDGLSDALDPKRKSRG